MTSPIVPVLPETAPFSDDQRSWLNGFFAGLLGADTGAATSTPSTEAPAIDAEEDDEDHPWHDAAMPLDERMALAEGRPLKSKMMAAMAQLDCGACGYLCQTYSAAIASGEEKNLTLCQPGGKDTAKKLKELFKSADITIEGKAPAATDAKNTVNTGVFDRKNPYPAPLLAATRLNTVTSSKDTRYVSVDIMHSGLSYKAGDALGVYPENCFGLVSEILSLLHATGGEIAMYRTQLICELDIIKPTDELLELMQANATDEADKTMLGKLLDSEEVNGLPAEPQVIDLLSHFESIKLSVKDFVTTLLPMSPRLYSISSSPKAYPDEVHLTVGVVEYEMAGRKRKGVASTYLGQRVHQHQPVRVFVQPSHGFAPPTDLNAPMIMVGPGTGIAPFRAFLQDRKADNATGKNWLFFGDQHEASDFLYRDELEQYAADGYLHQLSTAFSRDSDQKVYVQNRMMEHAAELWQWISESGHFYVCGDARRMAKDVDTALHTIIEQQGKMSSDDAKAYVKKMADEGRYQRDVY